MPKLGKTKPQKRSLLDKPNPLLKKPVGFGGLKAFPDRGALQAVVRMLSRTPATSMEFGGIVVSPWLSEVTNRKLDCDGAEDVAWRDLRSKLYWRRVGKSCS